MLSPEDIIGSWTLVSYEVRHPDGRVSLPMGDRPQGLLLYTADGGMSGQLARGDRKPFAADHLRGGSVTEKSDAADSFLSYGGRWRLEGNEVIHDVQVSLYPNWVGGQQRRNARVVDGKLELSTPPMPRAEGFLSAYLVWRRP
jgi:hypothetical protein